MDAYVLGLLGLGAMLAHRLPRAWCHEISRLCRPRHGRRGRYRPHRDDAPDHGFRNRASFFCSARLRKAIIMAFEQTREKYRNILKSKGYPWKSTN